MTQQQRWWRAAATTSSKTTRMLYCLLTEGRSGVVRSVRGGRRRRTCRWRDARRGGATRSGGGTARGRRPPLCAEAEEASWRVLLCRHYYIHDVTSRVVPLLLQGEGSWHGTSPPHRRRGQSGTVRVVVQRYRTDGGGRWMQSSGRERHLVCRRRPRRFAQPLCPAW